MPTPMATALAALSHRFSLGFRLLVITTLLALAGTAAADESLNAVKPGSLPALPEAAQVQQLLDVDGRLLARSGDKAWLLDKNGKAWTAATGISNEVVQDIVRNGDKTWVLTGPDASHSDQLQQLTLKGESLGKGQSLALPSPLGNAHAAALDGALFVAGVDDSGVTQLYKKPTDAAQWQPQPIWPGAAAVVALQAQKGALYAVVGNNGAQQLLRWNAEKGWHELPAIGGDVVPGSLRALGQAHLLMQVTDAVGSSHARTFHTITSSWADLADTDANAPLASASWGNVLAWANADGSLHTFELQSGKHLLGWMDWAVIVIYLGAMLGMGAYFYFREKRASTADFFVGGRSIPFWAAGVSLYATNTSSISFIAIPAKAFETNWQYLTNNLIAVLGLMFVAVWIVPLLRRLDLMSVFSYLETRFHPAIRMLASALCIVMQIGARMSVVLFLPALAIATITGISVVWSIMMMGVFTILYTAMGSTLR